MSSTEKKNGPAIHFKGRGFYTTDNASRVDPNPPVEPLPVAHVAGCSCTSCSHHHHHHADTDQHEAQKQIDALDSVDSSAESILPARPEAFTEKKYLPLHLIPSEAVSIGQYLPVVELVQVNMDGKMHLQGRVGILYKTARGVREVRLLRHTVPLEGFTPFTHLSVVEQNFQALCTAVQFDAPGVLTTLLYDNPAVFGNSHAGDTPNHLVTGISTTTLAVQHMQALTLRDTRASARVVRNIVGLGPSGRGIVHGLHSGVNLQNHETVGGTATVTLTENASGIFSDPQGYERKTIYVLPSVVITPDLTINNRVLQLPIDRVATNLSRLQSSGLVIPDASRLVADALGKLESAGDDPIVDPEAGGLTRLGGELIQDVAEQPKQNQFLVKRPKQ